MRRGSTALPAALAALAVSATLGAAVAELARIEVVLARDRRAATAALLATDACLAEAIAGIAPGWDLAALLAGPDGRSGTPDDGSLALPAGCIGGASAAPGPAAPPRILLRLEASAGGGRRRLEAVIGRATAPGPPALLWLAAPPAWSAVAGTVTLDGADVDDPTAATWAGLAAPDDAAGLDDWLAGEGTHIRLGAGTGPALTSAPPPVAALAARVRAAAPAGSEVLVPGTPSTALALVAGDLGVTGSLRGAGLLFVDGILDIHGALDFTGVVIVSGGVRVAAGGSLTVSGALWVDAPGPEVVVDGSVVLRQSQGGIEAADRLLPLPRRAALLGLRDLG